MVSSSFFASASSRIGSSDGSRITLLRDPSRMLRMSCKHEDRSSQICTSQTKFENEKQCRHNDEGQLSRETSQLSCQKQISIKQT